ncbi:unnamed protein product, partial [marine sediment metagenome]
PLGKLINHMSNVPYLVEEIVNKLITYLLPEFVCLVSMVVFLSLLDPILGIIGFLFMVCYFSYIFRNVAEPQRLAKREAKFRADHHQGMLNTLDNMLYILVNDSFEYEKGSFNRSNQRHLRHFQDCERANSGLYKFLDTGTVAFLIAVSIRIFYIVKQKHSQGLDFAKYTSIFVILLFF